MNYFWLYNSTFLQIYLKTFGNVFIIHLKFNLKKYLAVYVSVCVVCVCGGGGGRGGTKGRRSLSSSDYTILSPHLLLIIEKQPCFNLRPRKGYGYDLFWSHWVNDTLSLTCLLIGDQRENLLKIKNIHDITWSPATFCREWLIGVFFVISVAEQLLTVNFLHYPMCLCRLGCTLLTWVILWKRARLWTTKQQWERPVLTCHIGLYPCYQGVFVSMSAAYSQKNHDSLFLLCTN